MPVIIAPATAAKQDYLPGPHLSSQGCLYQDCSMSEESWRDWLFFKVRELTGNLKFCNIEGKVSSREGKLTNKCKFYCVKLIAKCLKENFSA